jgi:acetyl esterase/lipase
MKAILLALPMLANPPVYDAASTLRKLAPRYPHITIASAEAGAPIRERKNLVFSEAGAGLALDLYLPATGKRKWSLVILVHGGGWRSGDRSNLAPLAVRLAERGYAAATVSYRLSGQALYPAAIVDVKEAVGWLQARAGVFGFDPVRIAIAGGSAGGQIAALAGMTDRRVRAVVNIDGLSDFTSEEALRHEDDPTKNPSAAVAWFGGRYAEKPLLWREASPINHVGTESPPVLFIGSGEPRFSVGRAEMSRKLTAHGVRAETVILPDTPHSFWLFDPWLGPTVDAMVDFLGRALP